MQFNQNRLATLPALIGRGEGAVPGPPCPIEILESISPKRQARMTFARLLMEATRCIQKVEGDVSARLLFAVGVMRLDPSTRDTLAVAATTMISAAIRRLHGVQAPELLVTLNNHDGEIRFWTIDNSARLPSQSEDSLIRRIIAPIGGLYDFEHQGSLIESTFCFLFQLPGAFCGPGSLLPKGRSI